MGRAEYSKEDIQNYHFSQPSISKDEILLILQEKGYRITAQRKLLLDLILEGSYTSCKEIFYKAHEKNEKIGIATVYRFLNILEEVGIIKRSFIISFY